MEELKATSAKSPGRPKGSPNRKGRKERKKVQLVLPASLVEKLEEKACAEGVPKSWLVTDALKKYLN